jgi:hypothetical protein
MAFTSAYAQALRAIGQAMDVWHFEDFDVESYENSFFVRGIVRSAQPQKSSLLQAMFRKSRDRDARFIELRYTPDDVQRLEQEGQSRRRDANGMPDFYNVSQILRTVGAYVDSKRTRMRKLYKRGMKLTVEYETAEGLPNIEEHTVSSFYNFFVHMYLHRQRESTGK